MSVTLREPIGRRCQRRRRDVAQHCGVRDCDSRAAGYRYAAGPRRRAGLPGAAAWQHGTRAARRPRSFTVLAARAEPDSKQPE